MLNLASLVEALLLSDQIYTNADFVDIWSKGPEKGRLGNLLAGRITGVEWPGEFRRELESLVVLDPPWSTGLTNFRIDRLDLLSHHYGRECRRVREGEPKYLRYLEKYVSPYAEASRPFGSRGDVRMDVIVGTGFYTACSKILNIPFKPSALRADLLESKLSQEVARWRIESGEHVLDYLEDSRDVAARNNLSKLVETNMIDLHVPAVMALILKHAKDREQIIPLVLQLRERAEVKEFRYWLQELNRAIQFGSLREIKKYFRELEAVVGSVNKRNGLEMSDAATISLGWGPVSAKRTLPLPARLNFPIREKRHIWLVRKLYTAISESSSWRRDAARIILTDLPPWAKNRLDLQLGA